MELKNNGDSTFFERNEEGSWYIEIEGGLFPAKTDKVTSMIDEILDLRQNKIVSNNPASWNKYNLETENRGLFFSDEDGRRRIGIFVGDPGSTGSGDFIRVAGDDRIYQTDSSLSFYLGKNAPYWSDLNIYPGESLKEEEVALISVDADIQLGDTGDDRVEAGYTLTKSVQDNREFWIVQNSEEDLDQTKVRNFIRAVTTLEGDRFVPASEEIGDSVQGEIQIGTTGGKSYSLRIGKMTGTNEFYLQSSASPYTYSISSWSAGRVIQSLVNLVSPD
jgi:hypothetical protein